MKDCEALHLMNIKLANKSGFIPFLFPDVISEAVLKTRSIEPDEAATNTVSLANGSVLEIYYCLLSKIQEASLDAIHSQGQ